MQVDLSEVRNQVKTKTLRGAAKKKASDGQHDHQNQQRGHHIFGDALKAALQIKAEDQEAKRHCDEHEPNIQSGVRDHRTKPQRLILPDEEHNKIIDDPAGNDSIKSHEAYISEQSKISVNVPFLPGLLEFLIHSHRTRLRCPSYRKFHGHGRQPQKNQTDEINEDKASASVLPRHPREFPDIATSNRAARTQHDKTDAAAKLFSLVIHNYLPFKYLYFCLPLQILLADTICIFCCERSADDFTYLLYVCQEHKGTVRDPNVHRMFTVPDTMNIVHGVRYREDTVNNL